MDDRRKISGYLINPDYQGKFLVIFGAIGFLQAFVFFYAFKEVFHNIELFAQQGMDSDAIVAAVHQLQSSVFMLFGGVFILLMVVFLIVGFRFTHKTAGAVYHMQKTFMNSEKEGSLKEMKLRDGDFFREAEQAYNDMVKKLKK